MGKPSLSSRIFITPLPASMWVCSSTTFDTSERASIRVSSSVPVLWISIKAAPDFDIAMDERA
jgi:hypothetical protein